MTPDPLFRCWESTSGANGAAPRVGPYALTRIWTTAGLTRCVKASSELLSSLSVSKSFWCEEVWARRTEVGTKLQVIHSHKAHTVILCLMRHPFLYGKILFSLNQNSSREFPIVGALKRSTPAYVNSRGPPVREAGPIGIVMGCDTPQALLGFHGAAKIVRRHTHLVTEQV